jgi:MFS family permease
MGADKNKRVIFLYSAFQFFFSLLVWIPVFYEYQKQIGLSDTQIFRIQSIYYLAFCFLEIPTGFLADKVGYRKCLKWGAWTLVFANLLPIFSQNYPGFLWHFMLIAVSRSFISGASAAYLYDYLDQHNAAAEYKSVEGKARAYGLIGKVVCWAAVGALMKWHITLPYWATAISAAVAVYYAYALPEVVKTQSLQKLTDAAGAVKHLFSNAYLFFVVLQGIGIFTLVRICQVNLYQPILKSKNFDLISFGWIMSIMTLFEALGSAYPNVLKRWMKDRVAVSLTTIIMALSLFLIPYGQQVATVLCLVLFSLASGLAFPIQKQLMNDAIKGATQFRATILSLESIVDRAVCAWMATQLGVFIDGGRLNDFLIYSGVITLSFISLLTLAFQFGKSRRQRARRLVLKEETI